MSFDPEYGQTLLAEEDLESVTEQARAVVGDPVRKADVFDLEQAIWAQVAWSVPARRWRADLGRVDRRSALRTSHIRNVISY